MMCTIATLVKVSFLCLACFLLIAEILVVSTGKVSYLEGLVSEMMKLRQKKFHFVGGRCECLSGSTEHCLMVWQCYYYGQLEVTAVVNSYCYGSVLANYLCLRVMLQDLACLNRDLSKVIIIDCDSKAFAMQPENAFLLKKWSGDDGDRTLIDLAAFLQSESQLA